ncbi:MAG: hypothetical protein MJY49_03070 [Bacteroidales bacterium]|nr:hypothetical protein [Bacteroidales bacterium]
MKKIIYVIMLVILGACNPEYISESYWETLTYTVVNKESSTQLDPVTEFLFDIQTTETVYRLILRSPSGNIKSIEVKREDYYKWDVGDDYIQREQRWRKVKNPNYVPKNKKK